MRYKHIKTGNIYELINIANECDTEKFPRMVVYFSLIDGKVHARPFNDFMNAFEFIGENKGDVIMNKDEVLNQIKEVELKLAKYKPNSIMGVHWSSKLAELKRKLGAMK